MFPTLFNIGPLEIHSYGMAMAIGFALALWLGYRAVQRQGISTNRFIELYIGMLLFSLGGSRLLYVVTNVREFYQSCDQAIHAPAPSFVQLIYGCSRPLHFWEGGLIFYGGLFSALFWIWWYCRRYRLKFYQIADIIAPLTALGHAFGRLGCFSVGCCYGKMTTSIFGVHFPRESIAFQEMIAQKMISATMLHTPSLHPTQLYEAWAELTIFTVITWYAPRKKAHGAVTFLYLALYGIARFFLEMLRADAERSFLIKSSTPRINVLLGFPPAELTLLSLAQAISLIMVITSVALMMISQRQETSRSSS